MKIITINSKTYGSKDVFVDDEDYEKVSAITWSVKKFEGDIFYAMKTIRISKTKCKTVYLHRFLMNVTERSIHVDHRDRNGLNCTRSNMRLCSCSDNGKNRRSKINGTSKYLGVYKINAKWKLASGEIKIYVYFKASITVERGSKKSVTLGHFKAEEDAARAYDEAAKIHHGEFANLNFK